MRQSLFGDWYIESEDDDLGALLLDCEDFYAEVIEDEETPGKWAFEVRDNESGDTLAASDSIFESRDAARKYLRGWVKDIQ